MTPKWGFGVAMLPVGALCFYQAHFGRTVLPKWPLWRISSTPYFTVSQSLAGHASARGVSHELLRAGAFALPPCPQIPHAPAPTLGGFGLWGVSHNFRAMSCNMRYGTDVPL